MHDHTPTGNQTDKPQNGQDQNRQQQQLRIVQKGQGVVSQERDVGIIDQCGQIEGIPQKSREEVARTSSEKRKEEELENVEVEVEREEGAVGDLGFQKNTVRLATVLSPGFALRSYVAGFGRSHIKTIPVLQLLLLSRLDEQALRGSSPSPRRAAQTRQRGSPAIGAKQSSDDKVR